MTEKDEYIIKIIIREDVKMTPGKLGGQTAHAVNGVINSSSLYFHAQEEYTSNQMPKITLGAKNLFQLQKYYYKVNGSPHVEGFLVVDAARTEFNEPTITCFAIFGEKKHVDKITKGLSLFKGKNIMVK